MIETIEATDEAHLWRDALAVLRRVLGGNNNVLNLLERLEIDEQDPRARERISLAKQEMEDREERKQPLY